MKSSPTFSFIMILRPLYMLTGKYNHARSVGVVVKDIAVGAESSRFDSRAGRIRHSVANGRPPLRCFFGAVLPRR